MAYTLNTPTTTTDNNTSAEDFSSRKVKPKKLYQSNEYMADQIAQNIMKSAGLLNTSKEDRANLLADDSAFIETVNAASKANQLMLGSAYGSFFWKGLHENPAKIREFHTAFVTGANLDSKSPILALRNGLAGFHRFGKKASVHNHDQLFDMCLAAYRKWEHGLQTTQIRRTDRWVR